MTLFKTFLAVAALASAGGAFAAATPITSDQFTAGWQDQARTLVNRGPARLDPSKSAWYVSPITPPGRYVLVERRGDHAEVIPGYEFRVTSQPEREINMVLPAGYGDVLAIPIDYVPALANRREIPASR